MPAVLVLGDYRQTITVVRSLGRAGLRVILGGDDPDSSTARSRHVAAFECFADGGPARPPSTLESWLRAHRPQFVFPVGETQLRQVLAAPRLLALSTWVMPELATLRRCLDKRTLFELAPLLGIPLARWLRWSGPQGWREAARSLGFPLVVKRKDSASHLRDKKALILHSAAQLDEFLAEAATGGDAESLVLQKFAPGVRHNCHFAADGGRIVALLQQKVLRTDEADGTGIGLEGVTVAPSPTLRAYCERLLYRLGYTGVGCIQFLVDDATGEESFLELNPRLDSTAALACRVGYDFPRLAVEIASRARPAPLTVPYALGRHYHWLYGDLNAWRQGKIDLRMLAGAALRGCDLSLDWRDPAPGMHLLWRKLSQGARRRLQAPRLDTTSEPGAGS
jgi:predicted ATP-grasp superfamily ATP-dependent carboligase